MITSRRLAARLTRALEAKADQAAGADTVAAAAVTFDVTRRGSTVPEPAEPIHLGDAARDVPRPHRRLGLDGRTPTGRRRLLAAGASVAVLAVVAAGAVARQGGSDEGPVGTVTLGDAPAGWLVPAWVPEGMELWGVESSSPSGPAPGPEPEAPQLFADREGLIYVTSHRYELRRDTAEPVTVRGRSGQAGQAWDVAETDMGEAVAWEERGAPLTALYQGTTREEAIAVLESLEWRSGDLADGFAPPSGGPWSLLAEVVGGERSAGSDANLLYSRGVPAGDPAAGRLGLEIRTSSSSAMSGDYLEAWYRRGSAPGGGEGPLSRYDQDWHELTVLWPDGRSVTISPTGAAPSALPDRATLERIAGSLTVATEADLAALRDAAGANVEALPVVASVGTRIGTVDVHGESDFLRLCLRRPGAPGADCRTDLHGGGSSDDGTALATAEWTLDGTWYVAVASKGYEPQILGGSDPSSSPEAGELPAEATTVGEWTIRLVQPPPEVASVCTSFGPAVTCGHHRAA